MRAAPRRDPPIDDLLPLHRDTFQILVSLADGDRHGYAILLDVAQRTDGVVRLSPSTLYGAIKRLIDQALIEESPHRPASDDDERRRYYRLTRFGRQVASAEARRLERLLEAARATGLLGRERP